MRRIRIESDGTSVGTRITDVATGEEITVTQVTWTLDAKDGVARAVIHVFSPELAVEAEAEICAGHRVYRDEPDPGPIEVEDFRWWPPWRARRVG